HLPRCGAWKASWCLLGSLRWGCWHSWCDSLAARSCPKPGNCEGIPGWGRPPRPTSSDWRSALVRRSRNSCEILACGEHGSLLRADFERELVATDADLVTVVQDCGGADALALHL